MDHRIESLMTHIRRFGDARNAQGSNAVSVEAAAEEAIIVSMLNAAFTAHDARVKQLEDLCVERLTTGVALNREALADLIADHLGGTYHCGRVWSAWGVGTMTQDDFEPVDESNTPGEIADAIIAKLNADRAQSAQPDPWHQAVLNACMSTEACYEPEDPAKTVNQLIDWHVMNERHHAQSAQAVAEPSFQQRVQPWMMACFGPEISADRGERNHRFLEESLELVQSTGCTQSEAHQLVDYVFGRPVGEPEQEVGGVMVTLAALCLANGLDMHAAGETELARIWTKVEAIRAKQAAKPKHSPLPAAQPAVEPVAYLHDDGYWTAAKTEQGRALSDRLHFAGSPKIGVHLHPAPAPNALDAETPFLQETDQHLLHRFIETSEDDESYDISKDDVKRLANLGVLESCGFGRYGVTMFGYWAHEHFWHQNPSLPLKTNSDRDHEKRAAIAAQSAQKGGAL